MSKGSNGVEDLLQVKDLVKYYPVTAGVLGRTVGDVGGFRGASGRFNTQLRNCGATAVLLRRSSP